MKNKIHYALIVCILIIGLGFFSGCGKTKNTIETQKSTDTSTEIKIVDETTQGAMGKLCSDYCDGIILKYPEVSKRVCNGFCDDVIKQCEQSNASGLKFSAEDCINLGMLEPLSKKYSTIKAMVDSFDSKMQKNN